MSNLDVPKTYKLFVNGAFVRSESGRVAPVTGADGTVRRVATASRKDLREAVTAARGAQAGWQEATPYLRAQILYRIAEMADGRRHEMIDEDSRGGLDSSTAERDVDDAVASWIWWAGWADKIVSVLGTVNPVAGPFLNLSTPEPAGVVVAFPPSESPLRGMADVLGPILCGGNTVVALVPHHAAPAALTLAEVIATSDVPAGVVNILAADPSSLVPWCADHGDVDAIDVSGLSDDDRRDVEVRSASNLKRVAAVAGDRSPRAAGCFLDLKTVWHPAKL